MAHYQQLEFVRQLSNHMPAFFSKVRVLEVGSWDVNGSVRSFFKNADYVGVDVADGPGVDMVSRGEDISLPPDSFDVTISCECFEHNSAWSATFRNMVRMLKPGGLCIITCATLGRPEHGTKRTNPEASLTALNHFPDYYRNLSPADFKKELDLDGMFSEYKFFINPFSRDLYFIGVKHGGNAAIPAALSDDIKAIKKARRISALSEFRRRFKFLLHYISAKLLGERLYHDLMLKLR